MAKTKTNKQKIKELRTKIAKHKELIECYYTRNLDFLRLINNLVKANVKLEFLLEEERKARRRKKGTKKTMTRYQIMDFD